MQSRSERSTLGWLAILGYGTWCAIVWCIVADRPTDPVLEVNHRCPWEGTKTMFGGVCASLVGGSAKTNRAVWHSRPSENPTPPPTISASCASPNQRKTIDDTFHQRFLRSTPSFSAQILRPCRSYICLSTNSPRASAVVALKSVGFCPPPSSFSCPTPPHWHT
jgi:hypothetical protein